MDSASGFAATVVSGASDLAEKVVGSTQGFASAAQTIVNTLTTRKKAPILLMHGAIQADGSGSFPASPMGHLCETPLCDYLKVHVCLEQPYVISAGG